MTLSSPFSEPWPSTAAKSTRSKEPTTSSKPPGRGFLDVVHQNREGMRHREPRHLLFCWPPVHYAVEFLLPDVSRGDPRAADRGVSQTTIAAHSRKAVAGVGPLARASQPAGAGIRGLPERPYLHRVPAGLRSGIESHRIHLGPRGTDGTFSHFCYDLLLTPRTELI